MPAAWYNLPEAKNILGKIGANDVKIALHSDKPDFIWVLKDDSLEQRLEVLRFRCVDALVGYKLDDDGIKLKQQEHWFETEEAQASIHDRLALKFGDPSILYPYGLDSANLLWERDPLCIERQKKIRRDMARVQGSLENVGR